MTEQHQPDLVVIDEKFLVQNDFPMYAALLDMLGVHSLVLRDTTTNAVSNGCADRPTIKAAGGLGPYLRAKFSLADTTLGLTESDARGVCDETVWRPVVIGASTGGIEALLSVLSKYPASCPPTLIVQHINGNFLNGLAQRLNRHCDASVTPATQNAKIAPGHIYLAPGNSEHLMITPSSQRCRLHAAPPECGHRPSVDALFKSALDLAPELVAVLLTGMGKDGANGMALIKAAGGWTIAQDRQSCAVYGMPRAAQELGGVCETLPLRKIGDAILRAAAKPKRALSRVAR
ncbi:CheB methylesterase domain-containing protein [Roseovarius rhodophyticola]|uniref:protein-glutamate methylesterase n=1 Tax=Roseovarius rhodophyticola TaxID=3080827 RepID=A0ABZ2TG28_9RHOB